jgi:hypothetical protein
VLNALRVANADITAAVLGCCAIPQMYFLTHSGIFESFIV